MTATRMRSTSQICKRSKNNGFNGLKNDYISREYTFFSGSSLHKGRVLGASDETDYQMAH